MLGSGWSKLQASWLGQARSSRARLRAATVSAPVVLSAVLLASPAPAGATFPGVNGSIAYQGIGAGGFAVGSVTPDGAVQRELTAAGGNPAWSPNGSLIAFSAQTPTSAVELFTMAPDGSGRTQVTSVGSASFPAWSPDGSKIAFASFKAGNYDIWTVDANGANPTQLTSSPAEDIAPAWSPDGSKIAFQTNRDGDREIYTMDANGANPTDLTNRHATEEEAADWSPDGTKIAFDGTEPGAPTQVFVMNADGSGVTPVRPGNYPAWSPDQTRIAFASTSLGSTDLFTMKPDGTDVVQLTDDGVEKFFTDWQPLSPSSLTQTTVATPVTTIVYGDTTRLTSSVTSNGPAPTGVMQFRVDGVNDGDPVAVDAGGHAQHDPAFLLDVGDVTSATYGGDAHSGWSSGDAALQILPAGTTTSLAASVNPVARGHETDLTVTVTDTDTAVPPFGSVQFSIDGVPVDAPFDLDPNGQLAVTLVADGSAGDYQLTARYVDDTAAIADFRSSSSAITLRVTDPAATPTTASPSLPPAPARPAVTTVTKKTLASFANLLLRALRTRGFAALSGTGAIFNAAQPGTLTQHIYANVSTASARGAGAHRTLIATGQHSFRSAGTARLRLHLTSAGKRIVHRVSRLDVDVVTRYVPRTGPPVAATSHLRVKKRTARRARAARTVHTHAQADRRQLHIRP